jgi:hypothetical protein
MADERPPTDMREQNKTTIVTGGESRQIPIVRLFRA